MARKKKKKERKKIVTHRMIIFFSIALPAAALILLGVGFFYNASDKNVAVEDNASSGGKHIIKDVSFTFKTPDVAHAWNSFVDGVNRFTSKTRSEAEDLANKRKEKKNEKMKTDDVDSGVVDSSEAVVANEPIEVSDEGLSEE